MGYFKINGGKQLHGTVQISGSKNASLPILFSLIMTDGESKIHNLPKIGDIENTIEILRSIGVRVKLNDNSTLIKTENLTPETLNKTLTGKLRASTYLIGAMLSKFGKCEIPNYGGCNFSKRPIDMHIKTAKLLGATEDGNNLTAKHLHGGKIVFERQSVGATVNAILMTAGATGESEIYNYAKEPHILTLIDFLKTCGAEIEVTEEKLKVQGKPLHGGEITIPTDTMEFATYLILSAMQNNQIKIQGTPKEDITPLLQTLQNSGLKIIKSKELFTLSKKIQTKVYIITSPHPGFPTDIQPLIAPLLATTKGGTITDTVFADRFGYLNELNKFGIESEIKNNTATIKKSNLHNSTVAAKDLRGGAAEIITALTAKGESHILTPEVFLRGYENPIQKLKNIGADIEYIT